jgi:hypothetical protein
MEVQTDRHGTKRGGEQERDGDLVHGQYDFHLSRHENGRLIVVVVGHHDRGG